MSGLSKYPIRAYVAVHRSSLVVGELSEWRAAPGRDESHATLLAPSPLAAGQFLVWSWGTGGQSGQRAEIPARLEALSGCSARWACELRRAAGLHRRAHDDGVNAVVLASATIMDGVSGWLGWERRDLAAQAVGVMVFRCVLHVVLREQWCTLRTSRSWWSDLWIVGAHWRWGQLVRYCWKRWQSPLAVS